MKTTLARMVHAAVVVLAAWGASTASAQAEFTEAEVRKVDREHRKITLKHGEIKSLDMPPMTMVFNVGDPKLLADVKVGDKVKFRAVNEGGKMTVAEIQLSK